MKIDTIYKYIIAEKEIKMSNEYTKDILQHCKLMKCKLK